MSKVKEAIEAMIEESYLLGLSEDEIRQDFKRFIDTCYHVLQANVKDRGVISQLTESLAREQTCILIADREENATELVELETGSEPVPKDAREAFAEKAARRKRQILRCGSYASAATTNPYRSARSAPYRPPSRSHF